MTDRIPPQSVLREQYWKRRFRTGIRPIGKTVERAFDKAAGEDIQTLPETRATRASQIWWLRSRAFTLTIHLVQKIGQIKNLAGMPSSAVMWGC